MEKMAERKLLDYAVCHSCTCLIESIAMTVGFGRSGLIPDLNFLKGFMVVTALTAGSTLLMWIGERITQNGVGNGISIV